ncbi:MAG: CPBP family intramembrane glutamic endopeptidase [Bacteroidota bacterium]
MLADDYTYTLAILVPALIFGFVHFYQGWQAVIKIGAMAIMFGYIFVQTNSLWLLMVIHALIDLIGGLIAWRLLSTRRSTRM